MSIKKEIDRAVRRIAALDKNTAPKTPSEQDQIIANVEDAFSKMSFNFSNTTSITLSQNGKKRLVKQYNDLYSAENVLCHCIKQILDRVFKVKYPNRNKISRDLFSTSQLPYRCRTLRLLSLTLRIILIRYHQFTFLKNI